MSFSGDGGIGPPLLGDGLETDDLIGPSGGETRFSDDTTLLVGRGKDHPLIHDGPIDEPFIGVGFIGVEREEDVFKGVDFVDTDDGRDIVGDGLVIEVYATGDGREIGTGAGERENDGDLYDEVDGLEIGRE